MENVVRVTLEIILYGALVIGVGIPLLGGALSVAFRVIRYLVNEWNNFAE